MITEPSDSTSPSESLDVRALLDARLDAPLADEEFRFLELQGLIAEIEEAPARRRSRVAALAKAVQTVKTLRRAQGKEERQKSPKAGRLAIDDRDRRFALSRLLAIEAERDPEVCGFRERYLGGKPLEWARIEEWIGATAAADGEHSQYVEIALPADSSLRVPVEGPRIESEALLRDVHVEATVKVKFVSYGLPGKDRVQVVPVRAGGVLDELRRLSEKLARSYRWTADQATVFVLAGVTPYMVGVRIETVVGSAHPAASTVCLEIDPIVSPLEVQKAYSQIRQKMLEGIYRPLTEKHLKLAVFAAERRPPAKWAEVMAAWNEAHPEYGYEKETVFARDATAAQNRLLRPRLDADALL